MYRLWLKGQFFTIYFVKQILLVPIGMPRNYFEFCQLFPEIIDFPHALPQGFIAVGWFFSFKGSGKLSKVLMVHHQCQQHRRYMHYWHHWHLESLHYQYQRHSQSSGSLLAGTNDTGIGCIAGVIDTGEGRCDTELIRDEHFLYRTYLILNFLYEAYQVPNLFEMELIRYCPFLYCLIRY